MGSSIQRTCVENCMGTPTEQSEGNKTETTKMNLTLGGEASVGIFVPGLRGPAHDAMFVRHNVLLT